MDEKNPLDTFSQELEGFSQDTFKALKEILNLTLNPRDPDLEMLIKQKLAVAKVCGDLFKIVQAHQRTKAAERRAIARKKVYGERDRLKEKLERTKPPTKAEIEERKRIIAEKQKQIGKEMKP